MDAAALASAAQVRAIRARQHRLGMDEATYREVLAARYAVRSTKALTRAQASDLMHYLYGGPAPGAKARADREERSRRAGEEEMRAAAAERRGANAAARRAGKTVVVLATPGQRRAIAEMVEEMEWREEDGFWRWIAKQYGLDGVRTMDQASMVVRGLIAMRRHQDRARRGEDDGARE